MPASQDVLNTFQIYQKARVTFVQKVADLAKKGPQCVDLMQNAGVMNLLKPLLSDNVNACLPFRLSVVVIFFAFDGLFCFLNIWKIW